MPMGTVGHLINGGNSIPRLSQSQSTYYAYTNGDSTAYPDDNRISHNDAASSRPVSQGVSSSGTQSRPATSQGPNAPPTSATSVVGRPGSTETDVASSPTMRHGFAEAYSSEEYLTMLEQVSFLL